MTRQMALHTKEKERLETARINNQIRAGNAAVACLRAAVFICKNSDLAIDREDFLERAAFAYDNDR